MLSGDNGILQKATDAKTSTDNAQIKERIKLAYHSALIKDISDQKGEVQKTTFEDELEVEFPNKTISIENSTDNKEWIVTIDGITENVPIGKDTPIVLKVADHKNEKFDTNTELEDSFGNKIIVPVGFKITSDSPDNVTGGIVIEDVDANRANSDTTGSQFVWIPVGTGVNAINKNIDGTEKVEIALDRYNFYTIDSNWNIITNVTKFESETFMEEPIYREGSITNNKNSTAKELETFISSANSNHGYYIGRYEARTETKRTRTTSDSDLSKITEKESEYVYNWVSQLQAAKLSREMYDNTSFSSDLINSYAWDTAILFLQNCGINDYSIKRSSNDSFLDKGTNDSNYTGNTDSVCNIFDMASNCCEWTTETYKEDSSNSGVYRGGLFSGDGNASCRSNSALEGSDISYSFRPILYVK